MYTSMRPLQGVHNSIENDICFGAQRLKGCNPFVIRLCTDIPEKYSLLVLSFESTILALSQFRGDRRMAEAASRRLDSEACDKGQTAVHCRL